MARPLVVFPDGAEETLRVVRGLLALDVELAESGLTAHRTMPARDVYTAAPALLVADDGDAGTGFWPVGSDALMRLSVWASSPYRAHYLARLTSAHLMAYAGDARVRGFRFASRPFATTDPDDGTPIASFTITARLKTAA